MRTCPVFPKQLLENNAAEAMNPIIFLDIDGVLISSRSRLAFGGYPAFDPVSCGLVETICRISGSRLVICSAWRERRTRKEMEAILTSVSISSGHLHEDWATVIIGTREKEIIEWLERHPETDHHAILDDGVALEKLAPNLVQPDPDIGLTLENFIEICALLSIGFEETFTASGVKPTKEDRILFERLKQS